ncbi:hypothetical protein [Agreia sp. COWG]|uniref:hypothetical protein n=1 Tax=Agreia sp. COWG TaxID=2773266 RepID=UPI001926393A|nr:hypothetical protein [Agreia sp. COWG]CAD6010855.1 protein of unknown function [Agreia sp. COWG]
MKVASALFQIAVITRPAITEREVTVSSLKPRPPSFPNSPVLAVSTLTLLAAFFGGAAPAQAHVVDSDETSTASSE